MFWLGRDRTQRLRYAPLHCTQEAVRNDRADYQDIREQKHSTRKGTTTQTSLTAVVESLQTKRFQHCLMLYDLLAHQDVIISPFILHEKW